MPKQTVRESFGGGGNSGLLNYLSKESLKKVSTNLLSKDYEIFREFFSSGLRSCFSREGFTLAEVKITLGVIGVVAALTMPSLIAHYRGKVIKTQLKKSLSVVNQAVRAGMAKEGITDSSDLNSCISFGTAGANTFNRISLCGFFEENAKLLRQPKSHDYNSLLYSNVYSYYDLYDNILYPSDAAIRSIINVGANIDAFLYSLT